MLKKWGSLLNDILAKMQFKIQGYVDIDRLLKFIECDVAYNKKA